MGERFTGIRKKRATSESARAAPSAARRTQIALIANGFLVLLLLAWSTWESIHTRLEQERVLAVQATAFAAEKLTARLHAVERRLVDFVNQQGALLDALVSRPEATEMGEHLWSLLRLHFPQAVAVIVLDGGRFEVAALGDHPGEDGAMFLRRVARGRIPPVRLSDHEGTLHADFATAWLRGGEPAGSLLLCLSCEKLCRPEAMAVPKGHDLRLVSGPSEPSSAGGDLPDPRASPKALAEVRLDDTGWTLIDELDTDHLSEIIYSGLSTPGLGLGVALLLMTLALYQRVRSHSRKEREERIGLRESRLQLQSILSATTDGIILTDLEGRIELFNAAAEMIFGRQSEDILSTRVLVLLPDIFSSPSTVALLHQQGAAHFPPVVQETRGLREGGRELPVRLWIRSVRFDAKPHLLIVARDLTEHERNERQLLFLEQRDVLTGLLNRREFERRLAAILADHQRHPGGPLMVCHIDVDRFNLINDTCGHEAGDQLLKQLAVLINAKLHGAEIISRFGGDEFVVLFQNGTAEEVREICDGLMQTVRNFLFTWSDQSFDVAISMGLAEFTPESESPSNALSRADVACQMAKVNGRGRIHFYHDRDVKLARHHGDMHLVSTISKALNDGRFHLYAQPITPIAAATSGRRHFEVLLRMIDKEGTAIIPDRFIPAAERYILMPDVDRWVINRLFSLQSENLRAWHHIEPESFLFAINLSGTSITEEGFLRYLKRQFAEWDVPHKSICFEITETAAVGNLERARAFMQELSALGCSFALDDFGTGLSSYSYIKELPVNYLKIDGSFVRGMDKNPVDCALVESIVQIGHVLGLQTIAEWAEDATTLMRLRALKVDFAQGFGVGEPVPVCGLTLADAAVPPALEGTSDDQGNSSHPPSRSTARPTRAAVAASFRSPGLEP